MNLAHGTHVMGGYLKSLYSDAACALELILAEQR
jgi:hypothetical protein